MLAQTKQYLTHPRHRHDGSDTVYVAVLRCWKGVGIVILQERGTLEADLVNVGSDCTAESELSGCFVDHAGDADEGLDAIRYVRHR